MSSEDEREPVSKRVTSFWQREVMPQVKTGMAELGKAAEAVVPGLRKAGGKVKEYCGKVGEEVRGGVQDAKEIATELSEKVKPEKTDEWKKKTEEKGHEVAEGVRKAVDTVKPELEAAARDSADAIKKAGEKVAEMVHRKPKEK